MYDHIGLKVKDLDVAVRFYSAALAPLGHVLASKEATYAGIGPKGEPGQCKRNGPPASIAGRLRLVFLADSI